MNTVAKCLLATCACAMVLGEGVTAQASAAEVVLAKWKPQFANSPLEVQQWYRNQRNAHGGFCCDQADGHAYYRSYELNKDGSVTLADGTRIPKWQVLTGPNPTGHAVWWRNTRYVTYCFAPGSLF